MKLDDISNLQVHKMKKQIFSYLCVRTSIKGVSVAGRPYFSSFQGSSGSPLRGYRQASLSLEDLNQTVWIS